MIYYFAMLLAAAGAGGGLHMAINGTGMAQLSWCVAAALNVALCAYNLGKALKD